jgi:hypothetical protein
MSRSPNSPCKRTFINWLCVLRHDVFLCQGCNGECALDPGRNE